jgi:hypothetical protein
MTFRLVAAAALIWFVFFNDEKLPSPVKPDPQPRPAMHDQVEGVAAILADASIFDRMIFASVWEQCAAAAEGTLDDVEVTFDNTMGLRIFTQSALRVAWRRIAGASDKYKGLNEEVEELFTDVLGNEVRPVTEDMLDDYVDLCLALAWAGMPGDE